MVYSRTSRLSSASTACVGTQIRLRQRASQRTRRRCGWFIHAAALVVVCISTSGCEAISPLPSAAELPVGMYGVYQDNDVGAMNQSSWAFAQPARTQGNLVDAIKAVIAVDYLADELAVNPRWLQISPIAKQEMVQARVDIRRLLGIAPDASSELVVNSLVRALAAFQAGDQRSVKQALAVPVFTQAPEQTLYILTELPYIRSANVATSDVAAQAFPGGDNRR
jgi:hypothetical protein